MGLESLEILNLEHNDLIPKKGFPLNIFSSLLNLTSLLLVQEQSLRNASFPDVRRLTNLTKLSLDTVDVVVSMGEEFKELKVLSSLTLSGSAKIIGNHSFINVPHLRELRLIELDQLTELDTQALVHLKHLNRLEINSSPVGVKKTMRALEPLQKTNMAVIFFRQLFSTSRNQAPDMISQNGILDRNKTKHLLDICVREFTLTDSHIYVITFDALVSETWQRCLKFIDLSENPLKGTVMAFARLLTMRNLEVIFVRNCLRSSGKNTLIPDKLTAARSQSQVNECRSESSKINHSEAGNNRVQRVLFGPDHSSGIFVYVSDSLHFIDISNCITSGKLDISVTFRGAQNLFFLDLSDNGFERFTGAVSGFYGFKTFLLTGNDLEKLSSTFFDTCQSLEYVDLTNTNLNPDFFCSSSERLFQKLTKLKKLSLDGNSLTLLSPNTFSSNRQITHLLLAGNRFNHVPFNLKNTPELQVLDLQNNAIVSLDQETTGNLDQLAVDSDGFQLKLGGNVMLCVCESFHYLYWLGHTSVILDRDGNYSCINNDRVLSHTKAFADPIAMWRQCSGQFYFSVSIFLFCTLIIGFLTTLVITRNKTFILSSLLQMFTKFKVLKSKDYKIGVFIGYADRDYVFACTDLRQYIENTLVLTTYLQDRDLLPTFDMAQGIVEAINSSWRILLVVNRTFLNDDHWSLFTMKSAVYALTPTNPDRVVVLVDRQLLSSLPADLLSSVPEDNIITVSRWEMTYRLREMLRTRLL
ncbi:unnamed protein product [Lymnaea stagnalis]|uniref:TIR domain-containing protein n=1 Tax=Lymnaea stagnalis TaxID=6523 RepID=A0AAV2H622_LYMST